MAYIGKSIESGTFSVLDTSGNTYNGSNTTFSLGTQVGSPAQLLVSHDGVIQKPGTDYSLASGGTQITFSTAPASGASIFIVEISGAVGGPLDSDLNGSELILDADGDTSITADTDDQIDFKAGGTDVMSMTATGLTINDGTTITTADNTDTLTLTSTDADANAGPNLRLYRNSSSPADSDKFGQINFEGRNDNSQDFVATQIVVNSGDVSDGTEDAQIEFDVMTGGTLREYMCFASGSEPNITFNEDSQDIDFRVESNGNTHMFVVNGGGDRVGVGADPDLGVGLHIKSADSGSSVASGADELIVEGSGDTGLSILSGTDANGSIMFGDSADNDGGRIQYNPNNDRMMFTTAGTERMRLKSNGYLGITGTAGSGIERRLSVYGSHVTEDGLVWIQTSNGSGDDNLVLFFDGNTNNCGEITLDASGNTVAYVTSSDYRLKQNATDIADGITRLKQLKPYRFQWKSDPDKTVDGFFAHEAQEIVPESVKGTKDAMKTAENVVVNADGSVECYNIAKADWEQGKIDGKYANNSTWEASKSVIDRQGIDQAKLVPLLTAALKEAVTKIEALEARVTTLEG